MAVRLKISAEELNNSVIINDCTGTYGPNNKSGYGVYNDKIEDITDAFIEVQPPSSNEPYPFKIKTHPDFPNKEGFSFELLPYQFNMKVIESGEWKFKMTVVFVNKNGTFTRTAFATEVFTADVECCIDKMTSGQLKPGALNDPKQRLIIELSNMLESMKKQIEQGLHGKANETIELLKGHCQCCGCH